jgi:hypothetical protein
MCMYNNDMDIEQYEIYILQLKFSAAVNLFNHRNI